MSKFIFITAFFLLFASAFSIVTNHEGFAVKILTVFFWALLAGSIVYVFETYEK